MQRNSQLTQSGMPPGLQDWMQNYVGPDGQPYGDAMLWNVNQQLDTVDYNRGIYQGAVGGMEDWQGQFQDSPLHQAYGTMVDQPGDWLAPNREQINRQERQSGEQLAGTLAGRGLQDSGMRFAMGQQIRDAGNASYNTLWEGVRQAGLTGQKGMLDLGTSIETSLAGIRMAGIETPNDFSGLVQTMLDDAAHQAEMQVALEDIKLQGQIADQNWWNTLIGNVMGLGGQWLTRGA
jgi:hypothetical protein